MDVALIQLPETVSDDDPANVIFLAAFVMPDASKFAHVDVALTVTVNIPAAEASTKNTLSDPVGALAGVVPPTLPTRQWLV